MKVNISIYVIDWRPIILCCACDQQMNVTKGQTYQCPKCNGTKTVQEVYAAIRRIAPMEDRFLRSINI